jgi:dynein heavy chain
MSLRPDETFSLTTLLAIEFTVDQLEIIAKVSDVAGKEYSIEQALDKMEGEWKDIALEIIDYKCVGCLCLSNGSDLLIGRPRRTWCAAPRT